MGQWSDSNLLETLRQIIAGESLGQDTKPLPPEVSRPGGLWQRAVDHSRCAGWHAPLAGCHWRMPSSVPPIERDILPHVQVKALYVPFHKGGNKPPQMLIPFIRCLSFLPVAQVRAIFTALPVSCLVAAVLAGPRCVFADSVAARQSMLQATACVLPAAWQLSQASVACGAGDGARLLRPEGEELGRLLPGTEGAIRCNWHLLPTALRHYNCLMPVCCCSTR